MAVPPTTTPSSCDCSSSTGAVDTPTTTRLPSVKNCVEMR